MAIIGGAIRAIRDSKSTSRDPTTLCRQARVLARSLRHPETAPRPRLRGVTYDWQEVAGALEELRVALEQTLTAVARAHRGTQLALRDQRRAIAAFDHLYRGGARYLERSLELLGLPTLAAQVRPGVGRRGRPRKAGRVDAYPDLTARALRSAGMVAHPAPEASSGPSQEDLENAPDGVSGAREGDRKIVRGLRKLPGGRKKIVYGVHKSPAGRKKIVHGVRKHADGGKKSLQGLRKLATFGGTVVKSTVEPKQEPKRRSRERKIVLGLGNPKATRSAAEMPEATPGGTGAWTPPLRRVRETASAWWGRMRPAA